MELNGETPLEDVFWALTDHMTHSSRPFSGQPHTEQGRRGKTPVEGIRFRDLADCLARALIYAAGFTLPNEDEMYQRAADGTLNYNDLYALDLSPMDPVALIQNLGCEVEKIMGIYPNIVK